MRSETKYTKDIQKNPPPANQHLRENKNKIEKVRFGEGVDAKRSIDRRFSG